MTCPNCGEKDLWNALFRECWKCHYGLTLIDGRIIGRGREAIPVQASYVEDPEAFDSVRVRGERL